MIKHKDQRVGVFVDVQNMYYSAKNLFNSHVNYGEVLRSAVAGRRLIRSIAYVIKTDNDEEESFFSALDKQGFEVRMKDLQVFVGGEKKGDWDVGIAIDAWTMARSLDVVSLVTGDGDFLPLVEFLQYHGCLVEVLAFGETSSARLREAADDFINLSDDKRTYLLNSGKKAGSRRRLGTIIKR